MGQKINPIGIRLGITRTWNSRWFARQDYANFLHEDLRIRSTIKERLRHAGISRVEIERFANPVRVTIHTARPGIIIGRKGVEVERLKQQLERLTSKEVHINIKEVKLAELDAQLVAENVAQQLERRTSFRRAMKKALQASVQRGALGIKIHVAGRLGGAEIARSEWYREGRVPLHTFRADIDYGFAEARTTYGRIGVKCWIFKGEVIGEPRREAAPAEAEA